LNDWTLPPYRFDDKPPKPGQRRAQRPPEFACKDPPAAPRRLPRRPVESPPRAPGPEEPFRADLKHAKAKARGPQGRLDLDPAGRPAAAGRAAAGGGAGYVWWKYLRDTPPLPTREALFAVNRAPGIRFEDRNGQVIATRGPRYGQRITLAGVPNYVPLAFLAAEDRRFYKHGAIDPTASSAPPGSTTGPAAPCRAPRP
jgi:penicillin-binding protein 1A